MQANPRTTLWLCAYNGLTVATHLAILQEFMSWGGNLSHRVKSGDANIDRARSKVASWFLQEPEETAGNILCMVDADNAWRPGDLAMIARQAEEHQAVVGGIYPKRAFGAGPALRVADGAAGRWRIGEEKLMPVEYVGTGFIAIPRSILQRVAATLPTVVGGFQPFFMPFVITENGATEYPTDDWAFLARVRAVGGKVFASTYPRLTHEGSYTYRMVDSEITPPQDKDIALDIGKRPQAMAEALA